MGQFENRICRAPGLMISAASIAILFATSVQAAVLSDLQGAVSVNHGNGFQPASIGSSLAPGDRVRTSDGFAVIRYENGCTTRLGPRQVAAVFLEPPLCNGGGLKDGAAVAPGASELSLDPVLAGGLIAGAATGFAVAISSSSHGAAPVSP